MSEIRVENIIGETGVDAVNFTKGVNVTGIATATNVSVGSSVTASTFHGNGAALTNVSAGKILQVVQVVKTDTQTITNSGYPSTLTAISGLQPVITPTSSSSKILLQWSVNVSGGTNSHTSNLFYRTISGSEAEISAFKGDAASNRSRSAQQNYGGNDNIDIYKHHIFSGIYLDTPNTTSAITYSVKFRTNDSTIYINRSQNDSDANWSSRTASTFLLMEVSS